MLKNVKIRVQAEEEHISIKQVAKDCAPGFEEAVRSQLRKSRKWGWCTVKVTAYIPGVNTEGTAYLGCCSYSSKKDFIENSCYYDQMVEDATNDLQRNLEELYEDLAESLECLADAEDDDLGQLLAQAADALKAKVSFQKA